jgi:hypothetical protein
MKVILFFTDLDCQEQRINNWIFIPIDEQRHIFINKETPPYDWNYLRRTLPASGLDSGLEFYIAFHGTSMRNSSQDIINNIQTNFPGSRISYEFYSHSDRDLIWSSFCNLMTTSNFTLFDNLVKYIQPSWDLENFLELLHLLVNVPEEEGKERFSKALELIANLNLSKENENEIIKKLSAMVDTKDKERNILNSEYLKLYKEIYTMLNKLVMEEE